MRVTIAWVCLAPLIVLTSPIWGLHLAVTFVSKLEKPLHGVMMWIGKMCKVAEFCDFIEGSEKAKQRERQNIRRERQANKDF